MRSKRLVQGISEMFKNTIESGQIENILNGLVGVMNLIDCGFNWGNIEEEDHKNLNLMLKRIQD